MSLNINLPNIPGFSVEPPDWYVQAEKSGAIEQITSVSTIIGYVPYQRAKQVSIISGLVALALFAGGGPEKFSVAGVAILATAATFILKFKLEEEKVQIMRTHKKNRSRIKKC